MKKERIITIKNKNIDVKDGYSESFAEMLHIVFKLNRQKADSSETENKQDFARFIRYVRHEAAQEMRGGPSEPACRGWLQTTLSSILFT
jgi:hypothetical protein